ncbi:MAG TPA: glycosyltransferase family 39 protein [Oscillatoriaceae cyanobacterium]
MDAWRVARPARWLVLGMAALAIVTFLLALTSATPFVFPDELIYADLARNVALHGALLFRGTYLDLPTVLYSIAISPAYWVHDPQLSYRLAEALNAVMFASTACPLYLLARRWLPSGLALAAAFLPLVAPDCLYVGTILQENLFVPLVAWSVYLTIETLTRPSRGKAALLGLALGLAFLGKPQGLFLPPAIVGAFLVNELYRRSPKESLRRLGALWPAAVVYGGFLFGSMLKSVCLAHAKHVGLSTLLGTYSSGTGTAAHLTLSKLTLGCLFNLGSVTLAAGIVPFVLLAFHAVWAFREGEEDDRLYVTFVVLFGSLLLVSSVMVSAVAANAHERYCYYLVPLAWIGGLRVLVQHRLARGPLVALSILTAAVSASLLWWVAASGYTDTFSYMAAWRPILSLGVAKTVVLGVVVASAYACLSAIMLQRQAWRPALALAFAYGLTLTSLASIPRHALGQVYSAHEAYGDWIETQLGATAPLVVLADGQSQFDVYLCNFFTRRTLRVYYLKQPLMGWLDHPLAPTAAGELPALSRLPDGTRIAASQAVKLRLPLLARRNGVSLYVKRGSVYLEPSR